MSDHIEGMPYGTRGSYTRGCRCDACQEAARTYSSEYMRLRRIGGTGTPRAWQRATESYLAKRDLLIGKWYKELARLEADVIEVRRQIDLLENNDRKPQ